MSGVIKRKTMNRQNIQVFVRLRPSNDREHGSNVDCIQILGTQRLAIKQGHGKKYTFESIFGPSAGQLAIYKRVVKPLIAEIVAGYNCTVFTYGQTGTGKTYTMVGGMSSVSDVAWHSDGPAGIIPRAVAHLFEKLRSIQQEYTVRVSYIELYNEELYDLLSNNEVTSRIKLYEDPRQKGSVIIQGIEKRTVHNKEDIQQILERGQEKRRTVATSLNDGSSRSHAILCITVNTREITYSGEELVRTGKLNFVDLAGSENISKSGAVDLRAREAGTINQSLLNLGRVINGLVENSAHVPYRASKLTRILQDSLGGHTKTSIIATISPSVECLDETINTLEYANRARSITNQPEINQQMSEKAMMAQYTEEIERLRKDLVATQAGQGVFIAIENYNILMDNQKVRVNELEEKTTNIRDLEQRIKILEEEKEITESQWHDLNHSFNETNSKLTEIQNTVKNIQMKKEEQEHLACHYENNAKTLYEQAQTVLSSNKSTSLNESILHNKIEKLHRSGRKNYEIMLKMTDNMKDMHNKVKVDLNEIVTKYQDINNRLINTTKQIGDTHKENSIKTVLFITNITGQLQSTANSFRNILNDKQRYDKAFIHNNNNNSKAYTEIINKLPESNLKCTFLYLHASLNASRNKCLELANKTETKAQELNENITSMKYVTNEIMELKKMEIILKFKKLLLQLNEFPKRDKNILSELTKWRDEMNHVFNAGCDKLRGEILNLREKNVKTVDFAAVISDNFQKAIPGVQKVIEEFMGRNREAATTLANDVKSENIENIFSSAEEKIKAKVVQNIEVKNKLILEKSMQLSQQLKTFNMDFMKDNFKSLSKPKLLEMKLEGVLDNVMKEGQAIQDSSWALEHKSSTILIAIENLQEDSAEYSTSLSDQLEIQNNLLNTACKNLVEIKHNGDTPARSDSIKQIPLKRPTIREHLLSEYRQQKRTVKGNYQHDIEHS